MRLPDAEIGVPGPGWDAWADGKCELGSYMKVDLRTPRPLWYIRDPFGLIGSLRTHTVTEHKDGSITVTPSILDNADYSAQELRERGILSIVPGPDGRGKGWHGWLERGVWRSA